MASTPPISKPLVPHQFSHALYKVNGAPLHIQINKHKPQTNRQTDRSTDRQTAQVLNKRAYMHVGMYVCMYVPIHTLHTYIPTHAHARARTHTHTHTRTHTHTHTRTNRETRAIWRQDRCHNSAMRWFCGKACPPWAGTLILAAVRTAWHLCQGLGFNPWTILCSGSFACLHMVGPLCARSSMAKHRQWLLQYYTNSPLCPPCV